MRLNQISDIDGSSRPRKRVGRGMSSGTGKTAGKGMKGQKSRSGVAIKGFEGGQMPLHRRLPKRGFNSLNPSKFAIVNLGRLQQAVDAGKLDAGSRVDAAALIAAGVVRREGDGVRLLAKGELTAKLDLVVAGASGTAIAAVEKAGGSVTQTNARTEADFAAKAAKTERRKARAAKKK